MELRKRDKPTTALVLQREALISRATKRQRTCPFKPPARKLELPASEPSVVTEDGDEDDVHDADNEPESDVDPDNQEDAKAAAKRTRGRGRRTRTRTNRGLTFLQVARQRNIPVRSGKWNDAEEQYLRKLVSIFNSGLLEENDSRLSMRVWLSKMLSCCPMRISKKQTHGEKFKGKAKYVRNRDRIANMTQKEFAQHWHEVATLRANFLHQWARDEFAKWCGTNHAQHFAEWYVNIVERLPTPELAMNAKHVKPTETVLMPQWETIRSEIAEIDDKKTAHRASQRSHVDSESEDESEDAESCPSSPSEALEESLLCQESCCAISEADMALLANEDLSEPSQLYELELSVDAWSTEEEVWEVCDAAPVKYRTVGRASDIPSPIVLDFGPPSLWNADSAAKDVASPPNSSEWVDDLLSDDTLLAFDPATLLLLADVSTEQPYEAWFQQLSTPLQL